MGLISIGFPTVKNMSLSDHIIFEVRGSPSSVLILLLRLLPSDQKHSTRTCIKFVDVIFLVPNVDSREEKKILSLLTQNQGN